MYHGNAQLYADRDLEKVRSRLVRTIDAVLHAEETPAYLMTACRIDGRPGLFARDVYNRAPFRIQVTRAGLELSDDTYVRMTPDGAFECEGWAPFHPEYIAVKNLPGPRGRESENVNKGALLAFLFGILRVGDVGMVELHRLTSTIRTAHVVAEDDPEQLVATLRSLPR